MWSKMSNRYIRTTILAGVIMKRIVLLAVLVLVASQLPVENQCHAEELKALSNVKYGPHVRNVLDFYPAKSDKPTPVVLYIHGGGWQGGDKKTNPKVCRRESGTAREGFARRCGSRTAIYSFQGGRVEPR
jgi:poly(3-hydroxybutyrate) depolymerase